MAMRHLVLLWLLLPSMTEAAAAEESGGALWEMSVETLPVCDRQGLFLAGNRRLSLAGVSLYGELLVGVRGFSVTDDKGGHLPWRLEGPEGERIAVPNADFEEDASGYREVFLLFPAARQVTVTAFRRRATFQGEGLLEPAPQYPVCLRWFGLKQGPPQDFQFNVDFIKRFLEQDAPFSESASSDLWLTDPPAKRPDLFVVQSDAWLYVPLSGTYRFALDADDAGMLRVETKQGGIAAFKSRCGMFAGRPAGMSRRVDLEPALCDVTALLVEHVGAQGLVPYWQPPWAEGPSAIQPQHLARFVPAIVKEYRPLAAETPRFFVSAARLADFAFEGTDAGTTRRAVFDVGTVPEAGSAEALYHEDQPLLGGVSPDGLLTVRCLESGNVLAARRLVPAPPPPLRREYHRTLAVRVRPLLSSPVHFGREVLTVDFRWEILSRPALRQQFMPLQLRVERYGGEIREMQNHRMGDEGNVVLEVPLQHDEYPRIAYRVLLGGAEMMREEVEVAAIDDILKMTEAEDRKWPLGLESGQLRMIAGDSSGSEKMHVRKTLVILGRRLTAAEKRRWRPVKVVHSGLRPAGSLVVFSGGREPLQEHLSDLVSVPVSVHVSEDGVGGATEMLRQVLVDSQSLSGAVVILYPGGKSAEGMLSRFAYERVLAAALYTLRHRGALRVFVVEEGLQADTARRVAREWQAGFQVFHGDGTGWEEVVDRLGPWW